ENRRAKSSSCRTGSSMWSSESSRRSSVVGRQKIFFLILMTVHCFLVAGCGFTPLYGEGDGNVSAHYADVEVLNVPDREGQELRNALIDRLYTEGRPADPHYSLKIDPLTITHTDLGIQKDATVTRTEIEVGAHMQLVDRTSGKTLLDRSVRAVGGY